MLRGVVICLCEDGEVLPGAVVVVSSVFANISKCSVVMPKHFHPIRLLGTSSTVNIVLLFWILQLLRDELWHLMIHGNPFIKLWRILEEVFAIVIQHLLEFDFFIFVKDTIVMCFNSLLVCLPLSPCTSCEVLSSSSSSSWRLVDYYIFPIACRRNRFGPRVRIYALCSSSASARLLRYWL